MADLTVTIPDEDIADVLTYNNYDANKLIIDDSTDPVTYEAQNDFIVRMLAQIITGQLISLARDRAVQAAMDAATTQYASITTSNSVHVNPPTGGGLRA
jgi:hypothetical protein